MARALWLAGALRAEGVTVVEHPGWKTRGSASFDPIGVIGHHTAGPTRGDAPSLGTCVNGRPDLPGPLCQIVLARSGTAIVIASGKANHAGPGRWHGITSGGTHMIGIEAENTGRGEPWGKAQLDAYDRCIAAVLRHTGKGADFYCGHREWALPHGRKIDPTGIDLDAQRARVAARLGQHPTTPPATPTPAPGGPFMALTEQQQQDLYDKVMAIDLRSQDIANHTVPTDAKTVKAKGIDRVLRSLGVIENRKG